MLIFILIVILIVLFHKNSITISDLTAEIGTDFDNGYPATVTWISNSMTPFAIHLHGASIECINSPTIVQDSGTCWFNFNAPVKSMGLWSATGKVYNRSGNDITFTVSSSGKSASVTQEVSCILGSCEILCLRGNILAKNIVLEDSFKQLDGSYKQVKSIKRNIYNGMVYKSIFGTTVTEWHPIRFPGEKFIVAKEHPLLAHITVENVEVFHFQLENDKDDILFANDTLIAESWNSLPHGEEVIRDTNYQF